MSKTGIELITEERQRQIDVEGWTPEHDAEHKEAALAVAGACYALDAASVSSNASWGAIYSEQSQRLWPFDDEWRKVSPDPVRNLVKAGALIAAEIDRIHQAK